MKIVAPIFLLCGLGLALELSVRSGFIPTYILPAPSQVLHALYEYRNELAHALGQTLRATLVGFLLSVVVGFGVALLFNQVKFLRLALFPIAVFFQTVPIIAIAPLLVIWFGFGEPTVRAAAAIVAFFPILSSSMVGLESARREHLELARTFAASSWQILFHLEIPSAMRSVFGGLQIAAGLAVVGALVGEFVGGGGLGSLIDSARTEQRVDVVFAAVALSASFGLIFVTGVRLLELGFLRWRPFYET